MKEENEGGKSKRKIKEENQGGKLRWKVKEENQEGKSTIGNEKRFLALFAVFFLVF